MKTILSILTAVIIFHLSSIGQVNFSFRHITNNEGLASTNVLSIIQDSLGFMWFGTEDGLFRFDAYEFVTYKHKVGNKATLASNYCWTMFTDSENMLWIGNRHALNKIDPKTGLIEAYYFNSNHATNKTDYFIHSISEDHLNQLWVGTINGLFVLDKKTGQFKPFTTPLLKPNVTQFWAVVTDKQGNTWIGTNASNDGGLLKHTNNSDAILLQHQNGNPNSLANNNISHLFIDKSNNLWIAHRLGLDKYDIENQNFSHYSHQPNQANSLSSNYINCINQAPDGCIWIGTDQGIDIINENNQTLQHINHNRNIETSILSNSVHAIYFDREGTARIGTRDGGVDVYDKRMNKFCTYRAIPGTTGGLNHNNVQKFIEDTNGNIWISTDGGGLNLFNPKTLKFTDVYQANSNRFSNNKTIPNFI